MGRQTKYDEAFKQNEADLAGAQCSSELDRQFAVLDE
jgi:hypothetical protein